jgi:hypothetical protein
MVVSVSERLGPDSLPEALWLAGRVRQPLEARQRDDPEPTKHRNVGRAHLVYSAAASPGLQRSDSGKNNRG